MRTLGLALNALGLAFNALRTLCLAFDTLRLTLDPLRTSLAFDTLRLTLDALGTCLTLNALRLTFDALRAGLTLDALSPFGSGRPLALHPLGALLLRAFAPFGARAIAAVAAVALSTGRGRDRHRGNPGGKNHPGKHLISPFGRLERSVGRAVPTDGRIDPATYRTCMNRKCPCCSGS